MASKMTRSLFSERHIRVMERSKGFYWRHNAEKRLHGPFSTLPQVLEDVDFRASRRLTAAIESAEMMESEESIQDLVGFAGWIDNDTGRPDEENISRLSLH